MVATCRHPSSAKELIALREGYLDRCEIVSLDVVNEDSLHDAALKIKDHLDLLVCNAGVLNGYGGMMSAENTMDAFRDVLMTNIASPFFTTRYFLPHLRNSVSRFLS